MGNVLCVPSKSQPRSEESAPRRRKGVRHWIRKRIGRKRPQPEVSREHVHEEPEISKGSLSPENSQNVPLYASGALAVTSPRSVASPRSTTSSISTTGEDRSVTSTEVLACTTVAVQADTRVDDHTTRTVWAEKRSVTYVDSSSWPTSLNMATTTVVREEITTPTYVTVSSAIYTQVKSVCLSGQARCSITCTSEASQVTYLMSSPRQAVGSLSSPAIMPPSSQQEILPKLAAPAAPSIEALIKMYTLSPRVTSTIAPTAIVTVPKVVIPKMGTMVFAKSNIAVPVTLSGMVTLSDGPATEVNMPQMQSFHSSATGADASSKRKSSPKMGIRAINMTRSDDSVHRTYIPKMVTLPELTTEIITPVLKISMAELATLPEVTSASSAPDLKVNIPQNVTIPGVTKASENPVPKVNMTQMVTMLEVSTASEPPVPKVNMAKMVSTPEVTTANEVPDPNVNMPEIVTMHEVTKSEVPGSKVNIPKKVITPDVITASEVPDPNVYMPKMVTMPEVTIATEATVSNVSMSNVATMPEVTTVCEAPDLKVNTQDIVTRHEVDTGCKDPIPNIGMPEKVTLPEVTFASESCNSIVCIQEMVSLPEVTTGNEEPNAKVSMLTIPKVTTGCGYPVPNVSIQERITLPEVINVNEAHTPKNSMLKMATMPVVTTSIETPYPKATVTLMVTLPTVNNVIDEPFPKVTIPISVSLPITATSKLTVESIVALPVVTSSVKITIPQNAIPHIVSLPVTTSEIDSSLPHIAMPKMAELPISTSGSGLILPNVYVSKVATVQVTSSEISTSFPQITMASMDTLTCVNSKLEQTLPVSNMAKTAGEISGGKPPSPKVKMKGTADINVSLPDVEMKGTEPVSEVTTMHVTSTPTTVSWCYTLATVDSGTTSIVNSVTTTIVCATSTTDNAPYRPQSEIQMKSLGVDKVGSAAESSSDTIQKPRVSSKKTSSSKKETSAKKNEETPVPTKVNDDSASREKSRKDTKDFYDTNSLNSNKDATIKGSGQKRCKSGKAKCKDKPNDQVKINKCDNPLTDTDENSKYVDHKVKDEPSKKEEADINGHLNSTVGIETSARVSDIDSSAIESSTSSSLSVCSATSTVTDTMGNDKPKSIEEKFKILSKANEPIVTNDSMKNTRKPQSSIEKEQKPRKTMKEKREILVKLSQDNAMKKLAIEKPKCLTNDQKKDRTTAIKKLERQSFQGIGRAHSFFVVDLDEDSETHEEQPTEQHQCLSEPKRKVSDFEVPKREQEYNGELIPFTKPHVNKVPDVAKQEASQKISWKQTIPQGLYKNHVWLTGPPSYEPPRQALSPRLLELYGGNVREMRRSWVVPVCRQMETLKLEHNDFPGKWVFPAERYKYSPEINPVRTKTQENNKKSSINSKQAKHTKTVKTSSQVNVRTQAKAKPQTNKNGLSHWSRHEDLSKSRAKNPYNRKKQ